MSKVAKNTLIYSVGEIMPRIISFFLLPVLTQYLSPADYGIMSYTTTVMTFVLVIASLSLNTFLLRNYYTQKTETERKELIGSIFMFICIFNVALLLFQICVIPFLIESFGINIPFYPFFLLAIINNFFDVISIIPLVVYRIKENPKAFLYLSLSRVVLQFLLTYILVVEMNDGLLGTYMARLYVNIPFLFIYIYVISKNGVFVCKKVKIHEALKFSLPLLPASLSYLIVSLSDRIILERYIGLKELGIYSVAFTIALALNIIIQALYKSFEPLIFKKYSDNNFEEINLKMFKVYSIFVMCGGLAIALLSREIFLVVAAKDFYMGHELVPPMVIIVMLSGINTYLAMLYISAGKQKTVAILTTVSSVACIALNLMFIPIYGVWGSIFSTIFAMSIITIVFYARLSFNQLVLTYQIALIVIVLAAPFLFNRYMVDACFMLMFFLKALFVLIGFIVSFAFMNISVKNEFQQLRNKN